MKIVAEKISLAELKNRSNNSEINQKMTIYHKKLTKTRWQKLSFFEKTAHVGSEVERTILWRKKNSDYSKLAFFRSLELLDLTIATEKKFPRLKELTRLREVLVDYFFGENQYKSTDTLWRHYFYCFNYACQLKK